MFTRCTKCHTLQEITALQLRNSQGMLRCKKKKCSTLFNALELLSESKKQDTAIPQSLPWNQSTQLNGNIPWKTASILALCALIAQALYFEASALPQNPSFRPWLEIGCQRLTCRLPAYNNLQELTIVRSKLTPQSEQALVFNTVISNQGTFAQAYPKIKLSLLDYAGQPFSQRIFEAREYLSDPTAAAVLIRPDAATEINLTLATTQTKIGGYTAELIN